MVFIQSEKCYNDGVSRPPIRDNDLNYPYSISPTMLYLDLEDLFR